MSKSVRSDGTVQALFDDFLAEFDSSSDERINKALAWFSEKEDSGKERLALVGLRSLVQAYHYLDVRHRTVPAVIKKHLFLRLQQGRSKWGKQCPLDPPESQQPWDGQPADELREPDLSDLAEEDE